LIEQGKLPEAIWHWQQALRLEPDDAEAHCNLVVALEQVGRTQEAIEQYQLALRFRPGFVEAQNALARAQRPPSL
jgi:Flp pilus assembly protein TadD